MDYKRQPNYPKMEINHTVVKIILSTEGAWKLMNN